MLQIRTTKPFLHVVNKGDQSTETSHHHNKSKVREGISMEETAQTPRNRTRVYSDTGNMAPNKLNIVFIDPAVEEGHNYDIA